MATELPSKFSALLEREKHRLDRSLGEDLREIRASHGGGSYAVLGMQQRYETDVEERLSVLLATLSRLLAGAPAREIRDSTQELVRMAHAWLQSHIEECQGNLNGHAAKIGWPATDRFDLGRDRFHNALAAELDLLSNRTHAVVANSEAFVDLERIDELSSVPPGKFDVSRLVRLCEELNLCFSHYCFHAVAFITRAILDHVPPVFGFKTFKEVANNYDGGKSFRGVASQLEDVSRKVSDALLHMPMSDSEILPTLTQVDVRQQLDSVLGEVIRIRRKQV